MKLDKDTLLKLLQENSSEDLSFLQSPGYFPENIICVLHYRGLKVREDFFRALANSLGLPYLAADEINHNAALVALLPYRLLLDNLALPLEINRNKIRIVTANPLNEKFIQLLSKMFDVAQIEIVVGSSEAIAAAINAGYEDIHRVQALKDLYYRSPEESAQAVLVPWQKYFIGFGFLWLLFFVAFDHKLMVTVLFSVVNFIYFFTNLIRFYISFLGFRGSQRSVQVSDHELAELDTKTLPIYTILVPVFHESAILKQVLQNIYRLDYPKDRLDVKILMEEKDVETITEAKRLGLFGKPETVIEPMTAEEYRIFIRSFDPVIVPDAKIKTKPRACNYGLLRARGEYCVIYDAEDDPEIDQLKKAVVVFSHLPDDCVCLQCRLNFYNPGQNFLTRCFSLEYSFWFDYYLEGLAKVGAPIPLGGTSNHFRVKQLRELGGWDPYNVTEDADLGMRIAIRNLKTSMLASYTYEEANSRFWNWIRQRSRWCKGYIQTYLVHMRRPVALIKKIGFRRFLHFQLTIGGNFMLPLINPFLWGVTLLSFIWPASVQYLFYSPLLEVCYFNLFVGNLVYILLNVGPLIAKKNYRLIPFALTIPFYWALISFGDWKGLIQLVNRPFYWEKTQHGLSKKLAAK